MIHTSFPLYFRISEIDMHARVRLLYMVSTGSRSKSWWRLRRHLLLLREPVLTLGSEWKKSKVEVGILISKWKTKGITN